MAQPLKSLPMVFERKLKLLVCAGGVVVALVSTTAMAQNPDQDKNQGGAKMSTGRSLVLITLDTTRADALGAYGAKSPAHTPVLDALATRGVRYQRAVTPSPLTLPAHTSLLTGLDPPQHGLRDNGIGALSDALPTLATVLESQGYATAAVVGSRVLDRRFRLDRGFAEYNDKMGAENVGEYGYPERDAAAVSSAALAWLREKPSSPFFLWLHYYDAHAPYTPPQHLRPPGNTDKERYAAEIQYVDEQVGRLLKHLPGGGSDVLIAVVGDHGEALGEHGERTHGIFLYRSVMEVPLLLAGPGVPQGTIIPQTVPIRQLAATLLKLVGVSKHPLPRATLPLKAHGAEPPLGEPIYSETLLPATAYGWHPLKSLFDGRWRLIVAPRPELYDLITDPAETNNLINTRRPEARRLANALKDYEKNLQTHSPQPLQDSADLAADLRSLGYLGGMSDHASGDLDPKDGILLLKEFEQAKNLLQTDPGTGGGRPGPQTHRALAMLQSLVGKNPQNVPFLTRLAQTELAVGQGKQAIETYRQALELSPQLDFLHLQLAEALRQLGQIEAADNAYQKVLELNPRFAAAWLGRAELAHRSGNPSAEKNILRQAMEAETTSAALAIRLGQLEFADGAQQRAVELLRQATDISPEWPLPWLLRGQMEIQSGNPAEGRRSLQQVIRLAPQSPEAKQAQKTLRKQ